MVFDRSGFLKRRQPRTTEVKFGEGAVLIREPSTAELRKWRRSALKSDGSPDPAKVMYSDEALLAVTLVDEEGLPMFSFDEIYQGLFDDVPAADMNHLLSQVVALCGLDLAEARSLKDAVKNSVLTSVNGSSLN